ncbi:MAG TPA: D-aminoacyl-tRNA deacylase, partial [Methanomicrobiales archaeon]|nr:D-aminoacyl-tRNA deacylase [Methanomicrobiales archaeon]
MKIALVSSRQDAAGVNIRRHTLELLEEEKRSDPVWIPMEVEGRLIHQDGIDRDLSVDLIIFLSRHSSEKPIPVLTVHATGNFHAAALGGRAGELSPTAPAWMHAILRNLARHAPQGYRVSYEVTHHGPTDLVIPFLFVEIGSTAVEWADPQAGLAVARSVLTAAPIDAVNLIGFGGNHYAARETEIALRSRGAFGHIAHSREVGSLDL